MTERERICLVYLSDKMEATSAMIGKAIHQEIGHSQGGGGSNLAAIGSNVVGALRKRGLVGQNLNDLAWRLTEAGREAARDLVKEQGR